MDRDRVYSAIDSEREYQRKTYGESYKSIGEYLNLIRDYVAKATQADWYKGNDTDAMNCIRKIGALSVAAMETHGVTKRKTTKTPEDTSTWTYVNSSSINRVKYDPYRELFTVEFLNGGVYSYSNFPPKVYHQFLQARSKGQFYQRNIKGIYTLD